MMSVTAVVKLSEKDGKEIPIGEDRRLILSSHWNRRDLVVMEIEGVKFAVPADELERGIRSVGFAHR